jgi:hypothetical protein
VNIRRVLVQYVLSALLDIYLCLRATLPPGTSPPRLSPPCGSPSPPHLLHPLPSVPRDGQVDPRPMQRQVQGHAAITHTASVLGPGQVRLQCAGNDAEGTALGVSSLPQTAHIAAMHRLSVQCGCWRGRPSSPREQQLHIQYWHCSTLATVTTGPATWC